MARIPLELKGKSVYVAGHRGMVGSALTRRLAREDVDLIAAPHSELDLCDQAAVFDWKNYSQSELINIGTGEDITIAEFARVVAATVGYTGAISFDTSRPDGTPRKLLDVSRFAKLGWRATTSLQDGI